MSEGENHSTVTRGSISPARARLGGKAHALSGDSVRGGVEPAAYRTPLQGPALGLEAAKDGAQKALHLWPPEARDVGAVADDGQIVANDSPEADGGPQVAE